MRIDECQLMDFTKIVDARGSLSVLETSEHLPFAVQRLFYIYDVAASATRGTHAHRNLHEVIIPIAGSFDIKLHDGFNERQLTLSQPNQGLYLPPMIWIELSHFTDNAICLVLASLAYSETETIRDFETFLQAVRGVENAGSLS